MKNVHLTPQIKKFKLRVLIENAQIQIVALKEKGSKSIIFKNEVCTRPITPTQAKRALPYLTQILPCLIEICAFLNL